MNKVGLLGQFQAVEPLQEDLNLEPSTIGIG
jgi:hypothetical protein